ncbi:MAG: hypothetical protein R3B47_11870 [Bacteroidia bacterium]
MSWIQLRTMVLMALGIMVAAGAAAAFSVRLAKKHGLPIWNKTAKRILYQLAVPLITGAIVCAAGGLLAGLRLSPATLIFLWTDCSSAQGSIRIARFNCWG